MKRLGVGWQNNGKNQLRQARNNSKLVSYVPPLRSLVVHANTAPPLPQWATLFRPWRDWLEKR
jgi:hypothetical protein